MTEKEKMLAEKWYDANFDQDLINERARAKDICFELNHTRPSDTNKRKELINYFKQQRTMSNSQFLLILIMDGTLNLGKMSL
ncbi:hypothetical protein Sauau04_01413 [Staphylococcus aureus]